MDFAALLSKQMEDFRNMIISTQQQTAAMIEQMQNQSEMRFAKIEAELSNFIPAVDQRFGEVERRVEEEESSSQASVLELQKVQAYLSQQLAESKDKEAAVKAEIKKIETYLDADQIKGKQIQQNLEDKGQKFYKIEVFLDANQERDKVHTAMLYFIEDHLQGTAKKWYQIDEVFKQRDNRQPQRLMDGLMKEFKS